MPRVYRASVFTNQKEHWGSGLISEVYSDLTFEIVPISDDGLWNAMDAGEKPRTRGQKDWLVRTYAEVPSWNDPKESVADRTCLNDHLCAYPVHDDPDLHTRMAYGEFRSARGASLFDMKPGDWLLFIANLAYCDEPGEPQTKHPRTGWHLVGCLRAEHIEYAGGGKNYTSPRVKGHAHELCAKNWDYAGTLDAKHDMIICGPLHRKDQRFTHAVPIVTRDQALALVRDKDGNPPNMAGSSVMGRMASYTRSGRCIADTANPADRSYLARLRAAILAGNPTLADLLW